MSGALIQYYGSKCSMAPLIVRELGEHKFYLEPCCGSMAVLFGKKKSMFETVNDLNQDVINLAMCLASDKWKILYKRCSRVLPCESVLRMFKRELIDCDFSTAISLSDINKNHIDRAVKFLTLSSLGIGGVGGVDLSCQGIAVDYSQACRINVNRFRNAKHNMPFWHRRLADVTILNRNMFDILSKIKDRQELSIYIDPPYYVEGSVYKHNFSEDDHVELIEILSKFRKARIVVSYYENEFIDDLYRLCGWNKVMYNRITTMRHTKRVTEVLYINGESLSDASLFKQNENT